MKKWERLTESVCLQLGDCLDVLRTLPDNYVDSIITDPPYGLGNPDPNYIVKALEQWFAGDREHVPNGKGFMGRDWDAFVPPPAVWDECLRVLKPGGHISVFAGSRTVDLMGLSIRLAGFEMRDSLVWMYGSGFPKSLDVSKAIDKAAGVEREIVGENPLAAKQTGQVGTVALAGDRQPNLHITAPATDAAKQWEGWGTALKPAQEPILIARKPLGGTVAANVLEHGTGALNIDGCRVGSSGGRTVHTRSNGADRDRWEGNTPTGEVTDNGGRWPTNAVLTHGEDCADACVEGCPVAELDRQSGVSKSSGGAGNRSGKTGNGGTYGEYAGDRLGQNAGGLGDEGGASRFFPVFRYQAKAPKKERPKVDGVAHPTVKPLALMRWLVRLLTPPGGIVLDHFAGSGTTGEACQDEGMRCILVESFDDYAPLIRSRFEETA